MNLSRPQIFNLLDQILEENGDDFREWLASTDGGAGR